MGGGRTASNSLLWPGAMPSGPILTTPIGAGNARLSVVLATFNGERFLGRQLESLHHQSRLPDELVVVDDASSDGTVEIVEEFARYAPFPVDLTVNRSHQGTCASFERGFRRSLGEIVVVCDQDDVWLPEKLAATADHMEANPDSLLCFSDAVLVDADGARISRSRWRIAGFGVRQRERLSYDPLGEMLKRQIVSGCTAAVRRKLFDALLPFPAGLHPALPTMMYDRWISLVAAATGRITTIPERLVEYRIHPGQQIGIPALQLRRFAPQSALRAGQFMAPRSEKLGRFEYLAAHLAAIEKRLDCAGLATGTSSHVLALAGAHLELRRRVNGSGHAGRTAVVRDLLGEDGYRRFSLGVAAALSDVLR